MKFLFENWASLGKIALTAVLAYPALVLFLRVSGKRTLSKMNAFDLVVTVALGSTLATVLVSKQTPLADGLVALAALVLLQFAVAWLAVRSPRFRRVIKSEPTLLFHRGEFLHEQLRKERVVADEVTAAVRQSGILDLAEVESVVLETDGSFSVIKHTHVRPGKSALMNVKER